MLELFMWGTSCLELTVSTSSLHTQPTHLCVSCETDHKKKQGVGRIDRGASVGS